MEKIRILMENQETEVDVVRYFKLNNDQYLIFSLNEVDAQGYVKLYIEKVILDQITGNLSFVKVSDENEWSLIKDFIKEVIKSSKTGNLSVDDLNHDNLNGLSVTESKIFKLSSAFVELLGSNKKTFAESNVDSVPEREPAEPVIDNLEVEAQPEMEMQPAINQPEVGMPSFEMQPETIASINPEISSTDPSDLNVNVEAQSAVSETNIEDYKTMFETEKSKNEELVNKISELESKLESLKNILNN